MRSAEDRARIDAEASAWLARLKGPQRTAETEAALQDWLGTSEAHRAAFERATDLWDILPGAVAMSDPESATPPSRRFVPFAIAASLVAMIGAGFVSLHSSPDTVLLTHVGEHSSATLADGSQVALNTDSQLTVHFVRGLRQVSLDKGEAIFDVAHDASRPFLVTIGNEQVKALGTAFVIRRDGDDVGVTLLRGRVQVTQQGEILAILKPGERLSMDSGNKPRIDHPALDTITAWQHGEILFNETPLSDAVAEVNRYGSVHIVIGDARLANLSVSGVFTTNDVAEFAQAVAQLHGLHVRRQGDTLLILT